MNLTLTLPLETLIVRVQTSDATLGETAAALAKEGNLWRGLPVSSMLTLNPALNFAVFDALKARVLKLLSLRAGKKMHSLSVAQAFVLGSVSKVISTLVTCELPPRTLPSPLATASPTALQPCTPIGGA